MGGLSVLTDASPQGVAYCLAFPGWNFISDSHWRFFSASSDWRLCSVSQRSSHIC